MMKLTKIIKMAYVLVLNKEYKLKIIFMIIILD